MQPNWGLELFAPRLGVSPSFSITFSPQTPHTRHATGCDPFRAFVGCAWGIAHPPIRPRSTGVIRVLAGCTNQAEWRQRATKRNKNGLSDYQRGRGDCRSYQGLQQSPRYNPAFGTTLRRKCCGERSFFYTPWDPDGAVIRLEHLIAVGRVLRLRVES